MTGPLESRIECTIRKDKDSNLYLITQSSEFERTIVDKIMPFITVIRRYASCWKGGANFRSQIS